MLGVRGEEAHRGARAGGDGARSLAGGLCGCSSWAAGEGTGPELTEQGVRKGSQATGSLPVP